MMESSSTVLSRDVDLVYSPDDETESGKGYYLHRYKPTNATSRLYRTREEAEKAFAGGADAVDQVTRLCPECSGAGYFLETARVAGEAIDADQYEVACDECDGTGELEPVCAYCEGDGPFDADGYCANCSDSGLLDLPVRELGGGHAVVWL